MHTIQRMKGRCRSWTALVVALAVSVLALGLAPAQANELWVDPDKQNADEKVGNWAVADLGDDGTHFSFSAPDNMDNFLGAHVVLIPPETGTLTIVLNSNITQANQPHTANPLGPTTLNPLVMANDLTEIDVTSMFSGVAAGDYVTLNFALDDDSPNDTRVLGLRFHYDGPVGPTGETGVQEPALHEQDARARQFLIDSYAGA